MGNVCVRSDCVDLRELPADDFNALINEKYTVQRNPKTSDGIKPGQPGAAEDDGWKISAEPHRSECGVRYTWTNGHATNRIKGSDGTYCWRFFMDNESHEGDDHCCGWRRIRTFWPTRLKTQEEREAWWVWLEERASTLNYPAEKAEKAETAEKAEKIE
jgi:hypothetical protein